MFYAGIDWADQKHDALVLDEAGRKLGSIRVPHTPQGLDKLDAWLSSTLGGQGKEHMACIIETNHGLLISFLLEHGWPVYPVNPRTVDRRRMLSMPICWRRLGEPTSRICADSRPIVKRSPNSRG